MLKTLNLQKTRCSIPLSGWCVIYVQGTGTLREPPRWALAAQHRDIQRSQQRLRGSMVFVLARAQPTSRRSDSGGSVPVLKVLRCLYHQEKKRRPGHGNSRASPIVAEQASRTLKHTSTFVGLLGYRYIYDTLYIYIPGSSNVCLFFVVSGISFFFFPSGDNYRFRAISWF